MARELAPICTPHGSGGQFLSKWHVVMCAHEMRCSVRVHIHYNTGAAEMIEVEIGELRDSGRLWWGTGRSRRVPDDAIRGRLPAFALCDVLMFTRQRGVFIPAGKIAEIVRV